MLKKSASLRQGYSRQASGVPAFAEAATRRQGNAMLSSRTNSYAPGVNPSAVLPEERHVLACMGWAGEKASFFEPFFFLT